MTTYCTQADIEALWSVNDLLAAVDDDSSGTLNATETGYITRAIEHAAGKINACLEMRYDLTDLVDNTWCRDANAALAMYLLATRRGQTAADEITAQYRQLLLDLAEIRAGRQKVPGANESHDPTPRVTNFNITLPGDGTTVL